MAAEGKRDGDEAELDLDIDQNDKFQRREWRVSRLGWLLLALFVLAGLLGLLGSGPLSRVTAESDAGTVQAEYNRVAHYEAEDSLNLLFSPAAIEDGKVTVELTGSWISGAEVSTISPTPSTQYAIPGGVAMEFEVLQAGEVEAVFSFRAQEYGDLDLQATVGEDSVHFSQLVLP
jgi:hypothetical protein